MKSNIKKTIVALSIATLAAGSTHAAIVAFEAESGTLGTQFDPALANEDASGGFYITTETDNAASSDKPGSDDYTASYSFDLPAGTYDVYVRGLQTGANDDSFYYAKNFGDADPNPETGTDVWQTMNGGFGLTSSFGWSNVLTEPLTSEGEGGTVQWKIGAREDGFLIDSFAFVTEDQSVTHTDLDNALVPEPSAAVLISLAGLALALRRRR